MPSLAEWTSRLELAAERLEAAAAALFPAPEAGRLIDDYEFVEQIKDIGHVLDAFQADYVLNQEEEGGGVA
eukprot:13183843-Alexandrium_andersonii.AAC.1